MFKQADSVGSATPDPAVSNAETAPIPKPEISNKPPAGQTGPRGLQPRQTYSRVNTGTAPVPDAGTNAQKSMPLRGLEFLPKLSEVRMHTTATPRPSLNDMVKAAMDGAISRVDITNEAIRQIGGTVKTASPESLNSESLSTDLINKLADALGYVAEQLDKGASVELPAPAGGQPAPGSGPGALHTMKAETEGKSLQPGQSGGRPAGSEPMESGKHGPAPANAMGTNEDMQHGSWPADVMNGKTASDLAAVNLERLSKVAFLGAIGSALGRIGSRGLARSAVQKAAPSAIGGAQAASGLAQGTMKAVPWDAAGTKAIQRAGQMSGQSPFARRSSQDLLAGLANPKTAASIKEALLPNPGAVKVPLHKLKGSIGGGIANMGKGTTGAGPSSIVDMIRKKASEMAKAAEDANNPAQISAGKEPGPAASGTASGEAVPAQPADVSSQERLIDSNQAAINYTKRDAKRDSIADVGRVFNSPVMKDPVLSQMFDNSGKAGVKTSAANDAMKIAAARALLAKLATNAVTAKKSKESQMGGGGAAPPPGVPSPAFTQ